MNKKELLDKVKSLDSLSSEEKAYLIELVKTKKKYGLVWEDKPEDVEEKLRTHLPVLKEVKERAIINDTKTENHPNHILIEGDNLHALTALTFTHEAKIDFIYIDPPYNTGNNDFIYNDIYVDKEDTFRHSKWISFIEKRLKIAKKLLKPEGVIFISIDDNELSQLKMICDEIFSNTNFVACIPVIMNLKGNHDNYGFSDTHEYCLVYTATSGGCNFGFYDMEEEELEKDWQEDDYGYWKKADTLRRTGQDASREKRPKGWFPIFIKNEKEVYVTENNEPLNKEDYILWPVNDNSEELSWTWGKIKIKKDNHNLIVTKTKKGLNIYKKQRPQLGDLPTKKPKSFFYKPEYNTNTSTNELKKMFGKKIFDGPKPVPFIMDLLKIGMPKDGIVLDFFAGSGTTLEAVLKENESSIYTRTSILVTNNENNIAEDITFPRIKKLIEGYKDSKKNKVNGLTNNNLRYYQTHFVESLPSEVTNRKLTSLSTELLCIKENCYYEITDAHSLDPRKARVFTNNIGKNFIVIYHSRRMEETFQKIINIVPNISFKEKIFVYAFSEEKESLAQELYEIKDFIETVPLPQAIYNAYRATFRELQTDK